MQESIDESYQKLLKVYTPNQIEMIKANLNLKSDRLARALQYNFSTETETIQTQVEYLKEGWDDLEFSREVDNIDNVKAQEMIKEALVSLVQEGVI